MYEREEREICRGGVGWVPFYYGRLIVWCACVRAPAAACVCVRKLAGQALPPKSLRGRGRKLVLNQSSNSCSNNQQLLLKGKAGQGAGTYGLLLVLYSCFDPLHTTNVRLTAGRLEAVAMTILVQLPDWPDQLLIYQVSRLTAAHQYNISGPLFSYARYSNCAKLLRSWYNLAASLY